MLLDAHLTHYFYILLSKIAWLHPVSQMLGDASCSWQSDSSKCFTITEKYSNCITSIGYYHISYLNVSWNKFQYQNFYQKTDKVKSEHLTQSKKGYLPWGIALTE